MKKVFTLSFFTGLLLLPFAAVQAQQTPPAAKSKAAVGFADGVVATAGRRKITRRDVITMYAAFEPRVIGEVMLARYPQLGSTMNLDMETLCQNAFAGGTTRFENVMERLLIQQAMEEAAAQRHLQITEAAVNAKVHKELQVRCKGMELPTATDEEMAAKVGDSLYLLRWTARNTLLQQKLILADLNERLGHPIAEDDFYSVHAIFIRVTDKSGVFDPKATLEKTEGLRADILAHKRTFEDAAEKESGDASRAKQGAFGTVPRTLLKKEIEAELLTLKPDEITPPIEILEGYAIFRLDKRGKELTEADRKSAIATYLSTPKRSHEAIAHALKNVEWSTTIGKTPEWIKLTEEAENTPPQTPQKTLANSEKHSPAPH